MGSRSLEGLVVAVTGAGRGIGRSEALEVVAQGGNVVVNDVDANAATEVVEAAHRAGGNAIAHVGDCSDEGPAQALVDDAVKAFGRFDGLINNAGILRDSTIVKMSVEHWDSVVKVHLRGTFLPSQAAFRYWRESGQPGRVVCTSSTSGLLGTFGQSNYGAAKAAVAEFAVIAALEMAKFNVAVNAVAPSGRTRLTGGEEGALVAKGGFDFWSPDNVAPMVTWLVSPAAKVSGKVFGVLGDAVELYAPWTSAAAVRNDLKRWSHDDLDQAIPRLLERGGVGAAAANPMTRMRFSLDEITADIAASSCDDRHSDTAASPTPIK